MDGLQDCRHAGWVQLAEEKPLLKLGLMRSRGLLQCLFEICMTCWMRGSLKQFLFSIGNPLLQIQKH